MKKEIRRTIVTLEVTFECDSKSETSDAINDALDLVIRPNFNSIINGTKLLNVEEVDIDTEY